MTTHFRVELKQQLIPRQEVGCREQLHVLTYVLRVLDRVDLPERNRQRAKSLPVKGSTELFELLPAPDSETRWLRSSESHRRF